MDIYCASVSNFGFVITSRSQSGHFLIIPSTVSNNKQPKRPKTMHRIIANRTVLPGETASSSGNDLSVCCFGVIIARKARFLCLYLKIITPNCGCDGNATFRGATNYTKLPLGFFFVGYYLFISAVFVCQVYRYKLVPCRPNATRIT